MTRSTWLLGVVVCLVPLGCDGSSPAPTDGGTDAPSDAYLAPPDDAWSPPDAWHFTVAAHTPASTVPNQGGPILAHPQIVVITYADDPNRATLEAHAAWLVAPGGWLATVGAEYGIGAGTILGNVRRTDAAPDTIMATDIETLLQNGLADHSLPMAADGTTDGVLYVIYFPQHTVITDPMVGMSCMAYGGYHYESTTSSGAPFSFAVIPGCPTFNPALTDAEFQQEAASHEIFEAASDAFPTTNPGYEYSMTSPPYSPWLYVGPELGDLCALHVGPNAFWRMGTFVATRVWSNTAAMAEDQDPCIPAPNSGAPFYGVSIAPDSIQFAAAGSTATFGIDAWTTGPVTAFQLYATPVSGSFTPMVSVDRRMVNNGDHATLSVMVPAGTASGTYAVSYVEVGLSTTDYDAYPVVVVVP